MSHTVPVPSPTPNLMRLIDLSLTPTPLEPLAPLFDVASKEAIVKWFHSSAERVARIDVIIANG